MKKSLILLAIITSLLLTTIGFAADGTLPQCRSGALNFEVYNKDVSDCGDRSNPNIACIYGLGETIQPYGKILCEDNIGPNWYNTNGSISFANNPQQVTFTYYVYYNHQQRSQLVFTYNRGAVSDNCMEVFGGDVKCTLSKTEYDGHPVYSLTISKNT